MFKVIDYRGCVHDAYGAFIDTSGTVQFILCDASGKFYRTFATEGSFRLYEESTQITQDSILQNVTQHAESSQMWSWNETDDESWSHGTFDSREEAIEDALDNIDHIKRYLKTDKPTIYIGRCEYIPLRTDLDPDRAMEYLDEAYSDDSGCDYYLYEGVTTEQRQWLKDKLSDVMVEFHNMIGLKPCWFRVIEQEEIDLCEYLRLSSIFDR